MKQETVTHAPIVPPTEEGAFEFDTDLERSLLAGLSDAPEESPDGRDGPRREADLALAGPLRGETSNPAGPGPEPDSRLALLKDRPGSPSTPRPEPRGGGMHRPASTAGPETILDALLGPPIGKRPEAPVDPASGEETAPVTETDPAPPSGLVADLEDEPDAADRYSPEWLADWSSPAAAADPELELVLREEISGPGPVVASLDEPAALEPTSDQPDVVLPDEAQSTGSNPLLVEHDAGSRAFDDAAAEPATVAEPAAIAFATDPESESALREGFSDHPNPQVWPGGLSEAIATFASGQSSPLLLVDLDETPYPAGALHELAAVCEVGTVVIAFGSNASARFSREVLLAGVSEYLVKPLTARAVRDASARVASAGNSDAPGGWSVGFAGTGGSGASTLAAAAALVAAGQGRYVSVLDLNRTFPALAFLLDVEPAPGLVEVLSTVARAALHPEMVDGVRAARSDRIAVYGYPWSATPPPPPPVWAICELLVELQRRSHLVIVDGLDDAASRMSLLALVDARVLVVEPTAAGAAAAARVLARFDPIFDPGWPSLLVQNHTRKFKPRTGTRTLRSAGVAIEPEVVIPFEPSLPAVTDRGWPEARLPKSLRKPVAALVHRIVAASAPLPAGA